MGDCSVFGKGGIENVWMLALKEIIGLLYTGRSIVK